MAAIDLPTVLFLSCGTSFLLATFYWLLWQTRSEESSRRSYLLFCFSYAFYALRLVLQLSPFMHLVAVAVVNELLYVGWVSTIWMGVYVYRGKNALDYRSFVVPAMMCLWVAGAYMAGISFGLRTTPVHLAGAAYWLSAGIVVMYWHRERKNAVFVALAVMFWMHGLSTLSYPFTRDTWYAPYGFTLFSLFSLAIGMTFMTIALIEEEDEIRRHKDELENTVRERTGELMIARDEAEAANNAKSAFLANMNHELRTPLNAILGFSELLRRDPDLTRDQREKLEVVSRSGAHLLTLINDALEIAKIEAGRMQLHVAPFDLDDMAREVIEMVKNRAREKGLQVSLERSPDVPHFIRGDEVRLRQVLLNLASNAVKFTTHGGIAVRLYMVPDEKRRLVMEVSDTGPGISEKDRERLFKPFVQLSGSGEQQGTGLGLTISRQLVQLMGGTIDVESSIGAGTTFRILLPVIEVDADAVSASIRSASSGKVIGVAPGTLAYRILIAEDQPDSRLLLYQTMERIGLDVKVVANGADCVALFREWRPHLIWMDLRMPVMDGLEATDIIRGLPGGSEVKIVAVTASVFAEQQREMINRGLDDVLPKPCTLEDIYGCLQRHLDVVYRYDPEPGHIASAPAAVTPEMLAGLPAPLRMQLRQAVESLDAGRIAAVVRQVREIDRELGRMLESMVDDFDYPSILRALAEDVN